MIKISSCLLDKNNSCYIDGVTLGERISRSGKEHLWNERPPTVVDTIVIHYTSAANVTPDDPYDPGRILAIFCDYGVSSHYLISRDGAVYELVPDTQRAWHAGGSIMPDPDDRRGVNDFSIGIELAGIHTSAFTKEQYESLSVLSIDLEKRYKREFTYVGHENVAGQRAVDLGLRNEPKIDPGPQFDWLLFREMIKMLRE